jgi:hypothetical protein
MAKAMLSSALSSSDSGIGESMKLKRTLALVAGSALCVMANASLGYSQGAVPLPDTAPPPLTAPANPAAAGAKLPLRLDNTSSKEVDAYIDGGLKCKLPAGYKCDLQGPPGRYSIKFQRTDGKVFSDSFELPQFIAGKQHDDGTFLILEDRVEFGAGNPHLTPPSAEAAPHP